MTHGGSALPFLVVEPEDVRFACCLGDVYSFVLDVRSGISMHPPKPYIILYLLFPSSFVQEDKYSGLRLSYLDAEYSNTSSVVVAVSVCVIHTNINQCLLLNCLIIKGY